VINPHTNAMLLRQVLGFTDYVLVMSVNPGYGGQQFIPETLSKVRELAEYRREHGLSFNIEIDGGVGPENVAEVAQAGVDWAVAGSSVFRAPDPAAAVREMEKLAREATSVKV
jgi:ribulose-phosphate 3-epimerase